MRSVRLCVVVPRTMDGNLYDEFGNYIGPEIADDDENEEAEFVPPEDEEMQDEEDQSAQEEEGREICGYHNT